MALAVGIDLGTTNSVAALSTRSGIELVADAGGVRIHPSVVSFPPAGGLLVGTAARPRKTSDAANTIYSAKRLIGQNMRAPLVQLATGALPFTVEEGSNQQPIIIAGGRRMTVPEVSALVLGHLKRLAEKQLGEEVTEAVITVPANFSDAQRQATKESGRIAGLDVLRLVNEPTAAALAYGYGQRLDEVVCVFDFGGGTFDVSLLKIRSEIFEVLSTDGEFFLGGDDIDRILAEHLAAQLGRQHGVDPRNTPVGMARLQVAAEQIKKHLTSHPEAGGTIDGIAVDETGRTFAIDFSFTRQQFDNMIAGYVDRTIDVCRQALTAARVDARDISDVILVGGSTRVPLVRQRVAELFGREPASQINPDEVVAHGAAIQAAMLSSTSVAPIAPSATARTIALGSDIASALQHPGALLLDVTPATLRIATAGGFSEALLDRNSPIPIERSRVFTTAHDEQTKVVIECCRGESRRFRDNEVLGALELNDIPPGPRGQAQVEVTFRVDTDGILHVRAMDMRTGANCSARLNVVGAPAESGGGESPPAVEAR